MLSGKLGTLSVASPSNAPVYGPTGTYIPPHTPAYNTPATVQVSTWPELLAAINASHSGDVIEVTGDLPSNGQDTDLDTSHLQNFTMNVLVRPTLGQRFELDDFKWYVDHIVVAGFNLIGKYYRFQGCTEAHFWRCVDVTGYAAFNFSSADRSSMTEVILPTRAISVDVGDRIDITSVSNTYDAFYTTVRGCHIMSSWSGVAQYSPAIIPFTHITSPLSSGMIIGDAVVSTTGMKLGAIYLQAPNYSLLDSNTDQCDVQLLLNGTVINASDPFANKLPINTTSTVNFLNSYREKYPTVTLNPGDHVQVILQNVPVGMQNLDLYLMVGDANYQHNDVVQFIRANHSGGYPFSVRLLNNVLDSTENSIVQNGAGGYGDQDCGDFYIAGNMLCQNGQHGIGFGPGAYAGNPIKTIRTHVVNNLIYSNFDTTDASPITFAGNHSRRTDMWSGPDYAYDTTTNNLGDTSLPIRPVQMLTRPDMTLKWPECPINTNLLPLYVTPAGYFS